MLRMQLNLNKLFLACLAKLATVALLLTACFATRAMAQQHGQKTFGSAEAASHALVIALQTNDEKALIEILGRDGKQIISSGDEAEDAEARANFVRRFQQMHRLVDEPNATTTLYIGAENWPTPIPLVRKGNAWYFDTDAGKQEILFRRIGENEMSTIRVCEELAAAEKEFHSAQHGEYTYKIYSDEGQHNGLYWKTGQGDPPSPIGPLLASAVVDGDGKAREGAQAPFRGYFFHILTRQGKNGPGGAKDYISDGKMTGGFAFVAYPSEYGSSGVMTFVVNEAGEVFERDLGKKTEALAKSMKEYNLDSNWQKAQEPREETASGEQKTNP
jgi:Protein of unknown function (DUF2950)